LIIRVYNQDKVGSKVCAVVNLGSLWCAYSSVYRNTNWALLPSQNKVDSFFLNLVLFKNVVAQSIRQLGNPGEFVAKIGESRDCEIKERR